MKVLEIAENLIKISSVTDSKEESSPVFLIKGLLEKEARRAKVAIIRVGKRSKKILVAKLGRGRPSLMFNGHFDVVPAERSMFFPRVKGGKLFGRGAVDAKGPLACLVKVFLDLSCESLRGQLILACVGDEENVGERGSGVLRKKGIWGDFNLFAEPTDLVPIIAEKGFMRVKVRAYGKSSHAAFPEKGVNAIEHLFLAYEKIKEVVKARDDLLGSSTVSLGLIDGGTKINVVPDWCEGYFDIRYLPRQQSGELFSRIKEELREIGKYSVGLIGEGKPLRVDESSLFVRQVSGIAGRKPRGVAFATDARFFREKPCVVLGPGKPALAHQEGEAVDLSDLARAVEIYRKVALTILG